MGLKVSDEFTVPLCRGHHRQLHQAGNEMAWWEKLNVKPLDVAKGLWEETHPKSAAVPLRPTDLVCESQDTAEQIELIKSEPGESFAKAADET